MSADWGRTRAELRESPPTGRPLPRAAQELRSALQEARARRSSSRPHKYHAKKTEYNGRWYDSAAEARRAAELDLLVRAGEIESWLPQPTFDLIVNGYKVCVYRADFLVHGLKSSWIEDVKGMETRAFRIKLKLFRALHPDADIRILKR